MGETDDLLLRAARLYVHGAALGDDEASDLCRALGGQADALARAYVAAMAENERLKAIEGPHNTLVAHVGEIMQTRQGEWRETHRLEQEVEQLKVALHRLALRYVEHFPAVSLPGRTFPESWHAHVPGRSERDGWTTFMKQTRHASEAEALAAVLAGAEVEREAN